MEAPDKIYLIPDNRMDDNLSIIWCEAPYSTGAIEYIRTDAFIKKACEWLKENADYYIVHYRNNDVTCLDKSFIEGFREYIKEE